MHLRLFRRQLGQDAAQPQGVLAKGRSRPSVAGGGGVALIEDQVDHSHHRRQARGALDVRWQLERDMGLRQRALGADDALGDCRLGHDEGAGDLVRGEAAHQAQGKRHPCVGREYGVAGDKHQTKEIFVRRPRDMQLSFHRKDFPRALVYFDPGRQGRVLAFGRLVAADAVDGAAFGCGHQPAAGVVGDAPFRPLLESEHKRILRQVFRQPHVTHPAGEGSDELGRLHAPDGVQGALEVW